MNIDTSAPIFARREIVIEATIETVWNIQTGIDRWSEWQPDITSAKLDGDLKAGTFFRENSEAIVFFNKYPVLYGYSLVAPKAHKEQVTGDFSQEEYLRLQALIYAVAEATRIYVQPERVYILSLGSQQGNRHVHWHIAPLPAGLPFDEQQLNALRFSNGVLNLSEAERQELAAGLRRELARLGFA